MFCKSAILKSLVFLLSHFFLLLLTPILITIGVNYKGSGSSRFSAENKPKVKCDIIALTKIAFLSSSKQKTSLSLLANSCKKRGIKYGIYSPETTSPLEKLATGDALYRISDTTHYGFLELEYQLANKNVATFYQNNELLLIKHEENDSLILAKKGISVPKTATFIPKNRKLLKAIVEELGGFPLILKSLGGSHGVGVMRIDSYPSLFSISDYLLKQGGKFVLKEYIGSNSTARLIVLGEKVIDAIQYQANPDDFRSNEGKKPNVSRATFGKDVNRLAIQAVKALGLEFGGVDILISERGPLVAEVNFPCFFPRCQLLTGTDISGMMVDYLVEKSKN